MSARYFENLETRRLMSATLQSGVLRIDGTTGNDAISVNQYGTTVQTTVNGVNSFFNAGLVNSILVNAMAGHDRVSLQPGVTRPATIHGGSGNDTLYGGSGNDLINGNGGSDQIFGGGGHDRLYGDAAPSPFKPLINSSVIRAGSTIRNTASTSSLSSLGIISRIVTTPRVFIEADHDTIHGGAGNDTIYGGADNDRLFGDDGDDVLHGEAGADALFGGAGADRLFGGAGRDTLDGGAGHDFLDGGTEIDHIPFNVGDDRIQVGSFQVYGAIGVKYIQLGGEGGFLGRPLTNETGTPDGVGRYNHFAGGSIYWSPATGAHVIYGAIRDHWASMGWERGALGYPTSDELPAGDGVGRISRFQNGEIYWSPNTGTYIRRINMPLAMGDAQYDDWSCGPNSVSRVLRYYGHTSATYSTVRSVQLRDTDLVSRFKMGSRPSTLLSTMRRWKADAQRESRTSFDRVLQVLSEGKPVVALLGWGRDYTFGLGAVPGKLHWVALTGFDKSTQTMSYTDTNGQAKSMSFAEFNQKWNWYSSGAKGGFLTGTLDVPERTILY